MAERHRKLLDKLRRNELNFVNLRLLSYVGVGAALNETTVVSRLGCLCASTLTLASDVDAEQMLRFLSESQSLQSAHLTDFVFEEFGNLVQQDAMADMLHRVMVALSSNPNVQQVDLATRLLVRNESIDHLLRSRHCVTSLRFSPWEFAAGSVTARETLSAAFSANRTLEKLSLDCNTPASGAVESILQGLASHPCLEKLVLSADLRSDLQFSHATALVPLLAASTVLKTLTITGFRFGVEETRELLRALSGSRYLIRLELSWIQFSSAAATAFMDFIQRRLDAGMALCEMRIVRVRKLSGAPMASMLVGSSLRTLEFYTDTATPAFLSEFSRLAPWMRLHCLRLTLNSGRNHVTFAQIIDFLGQAVRLREFHIDRTDMLFETNLWMKTMRQNGNLWRVSIPSQCKGRNDGVDILTGEERSRMDMYCQRNRAMHELLSSPLDVDGAEPSVQTSQSLFPALFSCASSLPRTGPNSILTGLLSLGGTVGYH
jgi:hypothetical protein